MKKSIIALAALVGIASAADTQYVGFSGSGTVAAGTKVGDITLSDLMTYGSPSTTGGQFGATPSVNITGGDFHAGDYTLSLWIDTATLSESGSTVLFVYSGNSPANGQGSNGIVWNGADKTITMGQGAYNVGSQTFSYWNNASNKSTSNALTLGSGMVNLTFAVTGRSGSQTATVYVNGSEAQTLASYGGNMNGGSGTEPMRYYLNTNVHYGTVGLTNEKLLSSDQVIDFASQVVPEPATATLSLLALAGLAARRRRK